MILAQVRHRQASAHYSFSAISCKGQLLVNAGNILTTAAALGY